jgi:hypothetical protein
LTRPPAARRWLETTRDLLIRDGAPEQDATAFATLMIAVFRGLMLDLLQTGERDRVDAAFDILATLSERMTSRSPGAHGGRAKSRQSGRIPITVKSCPWRLVEL